MIATAVTRLRRRLVSGDAEDGAIAILVSVVLFFLIIPLLGYGTSVYVKSGTAAELQDAGDSGALAGAAQIPLLSPSNAVAYLNATTDDAASSVLTGALTALNLNGDANPLTAAQQQCLAQAASKGGLANGFALPNGPATCSAGYLADKSLLGSVTSCVTSAESSVGALTSDVPLLGALLTGTTATLEQQVSPIVGGLADIAPLLAHPGVSVTATWKADGPFDSLVQATPTTQTTTSIARQQVKNLIVLPEVSIPGVVNVNANPTAQQLKAAMDAILTSESQQLPGLTSSLVTSLGSALGGVLGGLGLSGLSGTVNGLSTSLAATSKACTGVIGGLQEDLDQIVDPPAYGPDTLTLVNQLVTGEPLTVVKIGSTLGIPFLDVTTCVKGSSVVQNVTSLLGSLAGSNNNSLNCTVNATGSARSVLAGS